MTSQNNSYPIDIIPRISYKIEMDVGLLLSKYPNLLVARLVEGKYEDYCSVSESGERFLTDRVFKNNMANLSFNLGGGRFDIDSHEHLRFLPVNKESSTRWNGRIVPKRLYNTSSFYTTYPICFGLCFYVKDIHNRTFPFYKHFDSEEDRNNYQERVSQKPTDKEMSFDAHVVGAFEKKYKRALVNPQIRVHHMPTMVNYWHMTLDTYRPINEKYIQPDEKQDSSDKSMFKALKQDLIQYHHVNERPNYCLDKIDYKKAIFCLFRLFHN